MIYKLNNKMEKNEFVRGLQVDNDVREAIVKMMRMKRVIAWLLYFVSFTFVVGAIVFLIMRWPGGTVMYLSLPATAVFLLVSIVTLSSTIAMEKALKMNNQSAFDEAMSKWNKRGLITFGGYILVVALLLFEVVFAIIMMIQNV